MEDSRKLIIYQAFPRIFGNRNRTRKKNGTIAENGCGKLNDFSDEVLGLIRDLGVTHIWYTGIIRHATQTDYTAYGIPRQHPAIVKGKAGSPYAIVDYYDIDPDLAVDVRCRMEEFEALLHRTHEAGMKVIIDFVPNHVAREYHSVTKPAGIRDLGENEDVTVHFSPNNNFYYYPNQPLAPQFNVDDYREFPAKATGNDCFSVHPTQNDWYETVKLNYAAGAELQNEKPDTWLKMREILHFWASKGVDGFRCDMAEMVPEEFWKWVISDLKGHFPHLIIIGEVYQPARYQGFLEAGFDYLYDKVGMYNCLRNVVCGRQPSAAITGEWQATDHIRTHMLYFLENHDEQRLASPFFAGSPQKAFPALLVATMLGKNPFMLYNGQEYGERGMDTEGFSGEDGRTSIFDYWSLNTLITGYFEREKQTEEQKQLAHSYRHIFHLAQQEKAVTKGKMFDLMYVNPQLGSQQFAFLRKEGREMLLVVANFSERAIRTEVFIPQHAIDYMQIRGRHFHAVDLLTEEQRNFELQADAMVKMEIPALSGRVWKMTDQK